MRETIIEPRWRHYRQWVRLSESDRAFLSEIEAVLQGIFVLSPEAALEVGYTCVAHARGAFGKEPAWTTIDYADKTLLRIRTYLDQGGKESQENCRGWVTELGRDIERGTVIMGHRSRDYNRAVCMLGRGIEEGTQALGEAIWYSSLSEPARGRGKAIASHKVRAHYLDLLRKVQGDLLGTEAYHQGPRLRVSSLASG